MIRLPDFFLTQNTSFPRKTNELKRIKNEGIKSNVVLCQWYISPSRTVSKFYISDLITDLNIETVMFEKR